MGFREYVSAKQGNFWAFSTDAILCDVCCFGGVERSGVVAGWIEESDKMGRRLVDRCGVSVFIKWGLCVFLV